MKTKAVAGQSLAGLSFEEWMALKFWLMGAAAHYAIDRIHIDDRPEDVEPHHYMATVKTRALAIARAHNRHDLLSTLRDPQPVSDASIKRIRQALDDLARLPLKVSPRPDDSLSKWLPARAANPLKRYGIKSVLELHQFAVQPHWYRKIPGFGRSCRKTSEALLASMREAKQLEPVTPNRNILPNAWRALEQGKAPEQLTGRAGRFRGPAQHCTLDADTDYQAIETWLKTQPNLNTRQAYRKELIRVQVWAVTKRGRAFSDLTIEDAGEYRDFLADPQPANDWIGPRRSIDSMDWRPFASALNASSRAYALQVIRTCARWLREQNYLVANPWASVRTNHDTAEPLNLERIPSREHWKLVRRLAGDLEHHQWEEAAAQRCRFLLDFLRGTGLRVSELANLRLGDIYEAEPGEWFIRVRGKGNKVGIIDLLPMPQNALKEYLRHRGLSSLIDQNDPGIPVISALDNPATPMQRRSIAQIIERFRKLAVRELEPSHKHLAAQLARLSPHTMRHIFGSHALENGAQLKDVQEGLRHANIRTTSGYVHSDKRQRRKRLAGALQ